MSKLVLNFTDTDISCDEQYRPLTDSLYDYWCISTVIFFFAVSVNVHTGHSGLPPLDKYYYTSSYQTVSRC